ncbi:MAG: hypothetical protein KDD02_14495 [Phaeodactylibacter sp.]|nr:hypothetical protein [Phaeodactylibacter sp.]MCB9302669.1 hypothetical protein [Lewinellaceae bacterium]
MRELIFPAQQHYWNYEEKLIARLDKEEENLERYKAGKKPNPLFIKRMESLIAVADGYMIATQNLLRAVSTAESVLRESDAALQAARGRVAVLEEENRKLRLFLQSLGKDPGLVGYMTVRDFYL